MGNVRGHYTVIPQRKHEERKTSFVRRAPLNSRDARGKDVTGINTSAG